MRQSPTVTRQTTSQGVTLPPSQAVTQPLLHVTSQQPQSTGVSTSGTAASGYHATPGVVRLAPAPNYQIDCSLVTGMVRWQEARFKSTFGDVVTLNVGALQAVGYTFDLCKCLKFCKSTVPAVQITLGVNRTMDLRLCSKSTLSKAVDSYLTKFLFLCI